MLPSLINYSIAEGREQYRTRSERFGWCNCLQLCRPTPKGYAGGRLSPLSCLWLKTAARPFSNLPCRVGAGRVCSRPLGPNSGLPDPFPVRSVGPGSPFWFDLTKTCALALLPLLSQCLSLCNTLTADSSSLGSILSLSRPGQSGPSREGLPLRFQYLHSIISISRRDNLHSPAGGFRVPALGVAFAVAPVGCFLVRDDRHIIP